MMILLVLSDPPPLQVDWMFVGSLAPATLAQMDSPRR
jgi:hypothetical protein